MVHHKTHTAPRRARWLNNPLRNAVERTLAGVGLLVLSPVIGACAVAVACESRGGGLYRQERVGRGGRRFQIVKIRTMVQDAEAASGPVWSVGRDPRVTALGRFLRRSHLDELPQLWNVVRGDMSIVGPRPERPVFTDQFMQQIPGYAGRLAVRPGITGLAQVSQGPDATADDVSRKLAYDLEYLQIASPGLDLLLVAKTIAPKLVRAPRATVEVLRRNPSPTTSSTEVTPV